MGFFFVTIDNISSKMFAKKRLSDEVARLSTHLAQGGGGVGVAVDVAKPDAKLPVKNRYSITLFSRLRVSKQILNSEVRTPFLLTHSCLGPDVYVRIYIYIYYDIDI